MSDSAKIILSLLIRGFKDAILGTLKLKDIDAGNVEEKEQPAENLTVLARRRAERSKKRETETLKEQKVLHRIFLCCAWNGGLFWLSIFVFNNAVIPLLKVVTHYLFGGSTTHYVIWSYIGPLLSWTFSALWVLPLFVLSKVINSLWFQDIADAAYRKSRGRPLMLPSLGKVLADLLFSILLQTFFLIQSVLAGLIPISGVGDVVCMLHLCLLYSLYAFEYKWFNMGWEVHKRLSYIENNWPYFVGFGMPLVVLTNLPSSYVVSGCVFSILFPLFIISANEAGSIPFTYDFPLRLFSPVILVTNKVFHHSVKHTKKVHQQPSGSPHKSCQS